MKKNNILVLLVLLLINCATNDFIGEQDEIIPKPQMKKNVSYLSKNTVNSITSTLMDLTIPSAYQTVNGGCVPTSGNAYGPNPIQLYDYIVRGYGKPKLDLNWTGVRLQAGNRPKIKTIRGQTTVDNDPFTNGFSIEFPFKANVTYEVTLETLTEDNIYREQHDKYDQNDNYHGLQKSQAFPTIAVELSDSPEIRGNNPCGSRPVLSSFLTDRNYYKTQKAEITTPPSYEQKSFTFNYSTLTEKNALIIYALPEFSSELNPHFVPESSFSIYLRKIKIVEKPYDPTYHVTNPRLNNNPCPGWRRCP